MSQEMIIEEGQENSCAIAVLDLPLNSSLGLDGQSIRLQRDDFVGVKGIPNSNINNADAGGFHLVIARAGACGTSEEQKHGNLAAVSVGFVLRTPTQQGESPLALVRRYDPSTEEVSSNLLDNMTISNLSENIASGTMERQRMVNYHDFISDDQSAAWTKLTNCISQRLLAERGIQNGSKLVPGCYEEDDKIPTIKDTNAVVDGSSVLYPAISVIDSRKSARHSQHEGTKKFLSTLPPSDRTSLLLDDKVHNLVLDMILKQQFRGHWQDLLGDVQLSYILFLHLQCLSSLEHWRDLVAMLSNVDGDGVERDSELYCELLQTLGRQVTTIDEDFFEDIEMSGDNFLVPALKKLCRTTAQIYDDEGMQAARTTLCRILENRFPNAFKSIDGNPRGPAPGSSMQIDEEDDDENRPVVVSNEEVEASAARLSQTPSKSGPTSTTDQYPPSVRSRYLVLFAAKLEHEDILMTCARALDDATDVSLVREAGTFLVEEVEPDTMEQ